MKMGLFAVRSTAIIELNTSSVVILVSFKRGFSFFVLWSTKRDVCQNVDAAHFHTVKADRD